MRNPNDAKYCCFKGLFIPRKISTIYAITLAGGVWIAYFICAFQDRRK